MRYPQKPSRPPEIKLLSLLEFIDQLLTYTVENAQDYDVVPFLEKMYKLNDESFSSMMSTFSIEAEAGTEYAYHTGEPFSVLEMRLSCKRPYHTVTDTELAEFKEQYEAYVGQEKDAHQKALSDYAAALITFQEALVQYNQNAQQKLKEEIAKLQ
jgi:hypothetical protein